jgi:hypothetical protein
VDAKIVDGNTIVATTTNVSWLRFHGFWNDSFPENKKQKPTIILDGNHLTGDLPPASGFWEQHFKKSGTTWTRASEADWKKHCSEIVKRPGLQGPIDDAFMDSFIMVRPTGAPMTEKLGAWTDEGLRHAMDEWHLQFRGEARVKDDKDITADDMAKSNLILWGDPRSNKVLAKIAKKLPIQWDESGVHVGKENYPANKYAPVLIYPNPLNPNHYVVLNTGFTFSEVGRPSNALQVPKLPDYAVVDITVPLAKRIPDGVAAAGFFDEEWKLK